MFFHFLTADTGVSGNVDVSFCVFDVRNDRLFDSVAQLYQALAVANAGGNSDKYGARIFFGHFKRLLDHFLAFLTVSGFQHRNFSVTCVVAVILFVLRRMLTGFVRRNDNETCVGSAVSDGKEGVCGDVETDVLHACKSSAAGNSCSECRFESDLFVRRPLSVYVLIRSEIFQNLCAGCSGVSRGKSDASLPHAAGNRFVARHENFLSHKNLRKD